MTRIITNIVLPLMALTILPNPVPADQTDELIEQLDVLKQEIFVLQDQLEEINSDIENRMSISGYTDVEYINSGKAGAEPGFRLHHLSLFFEKQISTQWKFFSEIEYEDAPFIEFDFVDNSTDSACDGCSGKIFVEAVNFTYAWRPELNLRGGRFFTPAGIWSVDHYPPFVPTQLRPEHIRKIFPQVVDGVAALGTLPMGSVFLNYDAYYGNGQGNSGSKDLNSDKATGFKLSFLFPAFKYLELGASAYQDTLNNNDDKRAYGAHLKTRVSDFALQGEYAGGTIDPAAAASYDLTGYYGQLVYGIGDWSVGARADYYETEKPGSLFEKTTNSVFVNYHVNESIVLKLEHHEIEEITNSVTADYGLTIASAVIYLGN